MSETLRLFLLQIALLAVVLVLHTYLGLHIVRRVLVFSDLVLDQLAAFAALLGLGLGIEYGSVASYLAALVAVFFGALLLAVIKPRSKSIPREAVIGIMYALALVGTLMVADKLPGGSSYITKTLSGSMLWVSGPLVGITAVVYLLLLVFHYKFRGKFIALAEKSGQLEKERLWDFLFFATQGVITVLIVPIAGVLLAYAFLMIPAAIATIFTKRWLRGLALGWAIGFLACVLGLCSSFSFDLPYGPTLVLFLGAFFMGTLVVRGLLMRRH